MRPIAVDAHQHFWNKAVPAYASWMTGRLTPLSGRHQPEDLEPALESADVTRTVLVQTWSSVTETMAYLALAARHDFIAGVVGWVDLTGESVAQQLDACLPLTRDAG